MGIAVIGDVFIDIKGFSTSTYIPYGRNLGTIEQIHGGVARNVAEDIANVELEPVFVGTVDDDAMGEAVIQKLNRHKVDTRYMKKVKNGMGTWLAVFDHNGDVVASVSKRPEHEAMVQILEESGDEIFANADSIAIEIDMDQEVTKKTFALAEKYNKKVYALVSNMSVAIERRDLIRKTECFVCNQQEAGILFSENYDDITPEELYQILPERIRSAKISKMVVTMGDKGAVYATLDGEKWYLSGTESRRRGYYGCRRCIFLWCLPGIDLWKDVTGGMRHRHETGIHCYLHIRKHLSAFYAGGIWYYEEINNGKYYYRDCRRLWFR